MMSKKIFFSFSSYLKYYRYSKTKFHIHSPFVYDLITQVFEKNHLSSDCEVIHKLYKEQCANSRVLETTDFGASKGRMVYVTKFLPVSKIARDSSINHKNGELLYRLVESFKPKSILELGTSLGISTLYMAKAAPQAKVFTIEGCAAKVEVARANFAKLSASNIEVCTGRFDTQLPTVLKKMSKPDFVFIDGHHQFRPTIDYFNLILNYSDEDTVIVIDDIHWSSGMEKAWKEIQGLTDITVTIDLYQMGLVFLRKSLSKQNFAIRY
jgi:predicted O-methyltransferase YrrM